MCACYAHWLCPLSWGARQEAARGHGVLWYLEIQMHPGWGLLCAALRASVYMGARAAKRSARGHYYALRGHREYILCVYGGGGILQTIKTSVTTHVTRHPHRTPVRGPTPGPTLTLEYRAQPVTLIDPAAPSLSLSLPSLHLPHPDRALLVIQARGCFRVTLTAFTHGQKAIKPR